MDHLKKGKAGEDKACEYLMNKGYEVLYRNFRAGKGEIDLIALNNKTIVFIEVKYRKDNRFGYPEEFVNRKKFIMIQQTAEEYIFQHNWNGNIRFDVVSITGEEPPVHLMDITM